MIYDKKALSDFLQAKIDSFPNEQTRPNYYLKQAIIALAQLHSVAGPQNALQGWYNSQYNAGLLTKGPSTEDIKFLSDGIENLISEINQNFDIKLKNPISADKTLGK